MTKRSRDRTRRARARVCVCVCVRGREQAGCVAEIGSNGFDEGGE